MNEVRIREIVREEIARHDAGLITALRADRGLNSAPQSPPRDGFAGLPEHLQPRGGT